MENKQNKTSKMPANIKKIKYSFVKVFNTSDLSRRRLPFMSIEAVNPGPKVFLTSCVHGDEVGGMIIIQEIFKIMRKLLIKGTVSAFPLINSIGFEATSRYITISGEDLNRSFPGDPNGSLAERIADKVLTTIIEKKPDVVLDLHNSWIRSIPYVFIDHVKSTVSTAAYAKSKIFMEKTGLLPVLDAEEAVTGDLSKNLITHGIPSLTLELGEPFVVNEDSVKCGVKVIMNILEHLEMIAPGGEHYVDAITENLKDKTIFFDPQVSSTSGIIRFLVKPGDIVKKDQHVARIYNAFGRPEETIHAVSDGIILGHSDFSVSYPGAHVISLGAFK